MATLKMNVNGFMMKEDEDYCGFWKFVDIEIMVEDDDVEKVIEKIKCGCENDNYINLDDEELVIQYYCDGGDEKDVLDYDGGEGFEVCKINDEIEVMEDF